MTLRPSGTITFLFTDIEASTRHWKEHNAWMKHAFARQEAIIRQAAAAQAHSGEPDLQQTIDQMLGELAAPSPWGHSPAQADRSQEINGIASDARSRNSFPVWLSEEVRPDILLKCLSAEV